MIQVYATKRGEKYRLFATGHAEKTKEGSLVCAAASTLIEALVLFARQHSACRCVRASLDRGYAFLSCRYGLCDTFAMTVTALSHLAEEYPAHLRVTLGADAVDDSASVV